MHEAQIVLRVALPPHRYPAVAQEPREEALHLPPAPVAPELPPVLRLRARPVPPVRRDQLDASCGQDSVQGVAIVGAITEKASRRIARKAGRKRRLNQRRLMRGSARHVDGERKTCAVCDGHDLGPLPALGLPDGRAPFFAGAKVASTAHSERSRPPRRTRSSASALSARASRPERFHAWKRRWHVAGEGYRSGRSCQRAPVLSTQSTPSRTSRSGMRGRPRAEAGSASKMGARTLHCSSVSRIGRRRQVRATSTTDF